MARAALLAVVLSASACPQREAAHEPAPGHTAGDASVQPSPRAASSKGPRPPLALELLPQLSAAGIGLSLRASQGPIELSSAVLFAAGSEAPANDAPAALRLRLDCDAAEARCIKLAAGAELLAPVWLAQPEGTRCDALWRPAAAGDYRLIVRSCDGSESAEVRVHWSGP
jgi:hypothetical protein